jgi:hypothetical protein
MSSISLKNSPAREFYAFLGGHLTPVGCHRYGPFQKNCNVGQVANLPKQRQIGNLPHVPMSQY